MISVSIDRAPVAVDESLRTPGYKAVMSKLGDGFQQDAGRDLGTFEPRRWLVKNEKTGADVFNPFALPSLAFGGGFRVCSGKPLSSKLDPPPFPCDRPF